MSCSIVKDKEPRQSVPLVFSQDQDCSIGVKERYEIDRCVEWIKSNNYSKVCLQFPESYLSDSVEVTLLIEEHLPEKTYILGDTSYGSCCVDEVAAQHVKGDAVIHFGHACLTPNLSLPVLYILPKRALDLSILESGPPPDKACFVVYDVGYNHITDKIHEFYTNEVIVPELLVNPNQHLKECCNNCSVKETGRHSQVRFSRGFCLQGNKVPDNFIYLGSVNDPLFTNFACLFKGSQMWYISENSLVEASTIRLFKQISFFTEEVKAAGSLTVVVVTLSIPGFHEAITYVKSLAKRWNKRVYVLSIAKPNIAKLTNFPEAEVFVVLGCPETHLINNKEIIQPVVGLLEVELALNENRSWDDPFSKDFKDILPGGQDYVSFPEDPPENAGHVSSITGRLAGQAMSGEMNSTALAINVDKSLVASISAKTGGLREKTWFGLDPSRGDTEPALAVQGRIGTSTGYNNEPEVSEGTDNA